MPFEPVDSALDLVALETKLGRRWKDEDLFHETLRRRDGQPEWVFYEGPPTANGRPGIHHVWARVFKDLFCRFHAMRGRYVARKAGWDCHGLPVELEVEKELGFSGKTDIEDFGIEAFNQRCRESVHRYVEDWSALTARIGMWLDTDDAYWTLDNEYVESVWWLFAQMWDKGLVYEGFKVVPYCGRCGTALSSHEVAVGYRDVTEESVYVRFPLVGDGGNANVDLVVWTTTPWTLISNVAVAIGPHLDYVRARTDGRDVVLARDRVEAVLGADAEIVGDVSVKDLVGRHYERPIELLPLDDASVIVAADFVTVDEGTGIVHLAPAFGEVDREVGEAQGLPMLNPLGPDATFDPSVAPYAGRFVKDADPEIITALDRDGRLLAVESYTHSYPHCWRCDTPLVYWAKPTWFARTSERRADLLRENEAIGWHPEHIKHGRFGDWLTNNVDWALSRDRYWGTPLPIWRCEDCGVDTRVGSVAELSELAGRDLVQLDLHRPYVDEVAIGCPGCGGRAKRVEPVLDAWFDSGSMPSAQFHFPFDHQDTFEARFPADFICEAIDQTRGWFYSLLAVNTLVFDRAPYRDVVCLGLIVDQDGQKMSKSRGNVLDPWEILDARGADALRWNFFSAGSPWTPKRVSVESVDETTRRLLLTLWNTHSFFTTYASLDGWEPGVTPRQDHVLDRWIRSRLASTIDETTIALEAFDALHAAQAIDRFVDDLSKWYVRRSRARFWNVDAAGVDGAAHATLHECLVTTSKLLAPFCPFVADDIHRTLAGSSVHLADWPLPDPALVDPSLEVEMARARQLVSLGLAARGDARLKVRQPLRRALLLGADDLPQEVIAEVSGALNVRAVEPVTDLEGLLEYAVVPNFPALGPRAGAQMPAVKDALAAADASALRRALDERGAVELELADGQRFTVRPDDVEVRAGAHEELVLAQDGDVAVALDVALDEELRLEGLARELIRALNEQRKADGLAIDDRIRVTLVADGVVADAARRHLEWLAREVLAVELDVVGPTGSDRIDETIELDGASVGLRVQRAGR